MKSTFIYALCEPNSRAVRYIGKADNPARRFKRHLSRSSKAKTHLGNWLRSLLSAGETPALVVLREVPLDQWDLAEERYIRLARGLGMRLVNGTDGGEGCFNPTLETRAKMSSRKLGKRPSAEARLNMSRSRLGVPRTPEFCANLSAALKGKPLPKKTLEAAHSPEANEKRRKSLTGVRKSPQHCANLGASRAGKPQSPEHVAKRVAAIKLSLAARKAAQT